MESVVLKEHAKEGIGIVERAVGKSSTLPALNSVLVTAEKNTLEFAATDLEIGIRYTVLAKNKKEGRAVIPSRFLSSLLGFIPDQQVTLKAQESTFHVQAKDHTSEVKTMDPEEFPIIPGPESGQATTEVEAQPFCHGLTQVAGFVSQSQTRPELTGVFFSFLPKELRLAATDSFRLAEKVLPFANKENIQEHQLILPSKAVREIISAFAERTGKIKIYISENQAVFEYISKDDAAAPQIQVISRLIDGEYPPYREVIPTSHSTKATLNKAQFLNQIKASAVFTGKREEVRLVCDPAKKGVTIASRSADLGEAESFLTGKLEGEKVTVSFNWRFLTEGLAQMRASEVQVLLNGEEGPALMVPTEEEHYRYVIMPMKA